MPSRDPWVIELESRPCRRAACGARPHEHCVTISGITATFPHAERRNDARRAEGRPFWPEQEGHWVPWAGPRPKRIPRPERPASDYPADDIAWLLNQAAIQQIIRELGYTRWTGRPGYPIRAMVGMVLAKEWFGLTGWAQAVRLTARHRKLRAVLGAAPSEWACYRFARQHPAAVLAASVVIDELCTEAG